MAPAMIKALGAGALLQAIAIVALAAETPPPAYQLAAYQAGIPSEVLYSVALQESGTRLRGQGSTWLETLKNYGYDGFMLIALALCASCLIVATSHGIM